MYIRATKQAINMASTKNVKGNRKMLEVQYAPTTDYYRIPDNLDLEDKSVVEEYWVKWRTLCIKYVGKEEIEKLEPETPCGDEFKHPDNVEIVDAEENYVEYEDESDDDDEKPCSDCYKKAYSAASAPDGVGVENIQVMCDCDEDDDETMCGCGNKNYKDLNNIPQCNYCDAAWCDDCGEKEMCRDCIKEYEETYAEFTHTECREYCDCTECQRTRPCDCGVCEVVGGSCEGEEIEEQKSI